jgi:hypothetical protein
MVGTDLRAVPTVGDLWSYPSRTLTQAKFPFWSAIITQAQGSVALSVNTGAIVTIQPPAGETWLIDLLASTRNVATATGENITFIRYQDFDGVTARIHGTVANVGIGLYKPYYEPKPIHVLRILTNSLYARLAVQNNAADTLDYGYSGFKLSQPLWSPRRLAANPGKPWKKPRSRPLPPKIRPLEKYACDILGADPARPEEYDTAIVLEEDTPLAVDPGTGFPVERLTVYVRAAVLDDLISKFKSGTEDPVNTGYRKYLDKWREEGIDLGV